MNALIIDVDGVLADYRTAHRRLLASLDGTDYQDASAYPRETRDRAYREIEASRDFWRTLEPYRGTWEALGRLAPVDQTYFVTRRFGATCRDQTTHWLREHGYPRYPSVIIVPTDAVKGDLARGLRARAVIDDQPEALHSVRTCPGWLVDRPWNAEATLRREQRRVESLSEVLDQIGI